MTDFLRASPACVAAAFVELTRRRVRADARGWLEQSLGAAARGDTAHVAVACAGAARHLGRGALGLHEAERTVLASAGVDWSVDGWQMDELGRVALVLETAHRVGALELDDLVEALW